MRTCLMLALLAAGTARAEGLNDYAWRWEVEVQADAPAYVLELDADVLSRVTQLDLSDLAVFNAAGEAVPFGPWPPKAGVGERREPMLWLRVPHPAPGGEERLDLHLQRDADGRLRSLDLQASPGAPPADAGYDLLVDRGEKPWPLSFVDVGLGAHGPEGVNLRVRVSASDDLDQWRVIGAGLPLVSLYDNGLSIERLRLELPRSDERYLRFSIEGDGTWPPLEALHAGEPRRYDDPRPLRTLSLSGRPEAEGSGSFLYDAGAPVWVESLDLQLADANSVAATQVFVRDHDEDYWQLASSFTAFQLGNGDTPVRHVAPDVGQRHGRQWRVATLPALARAPTLQLRYRPERFVLLAQGPGPYVLAAGSARARRPDYPIQAALAAMEGVPPDASLGPRTEAGGQAALARYRGEDWQRWLLWGVLALGAGLVLVVSLKVLKAGPKAG